MLLPDIDLTKILFLDVETVSQYANFEELPERFKNLWIKKANYIANEHETPEETYNRAAIYSEFGKIVCISVGFLAWQNNAYVLRIKSFFGDDEKTVLLDFFELLNKHFNTQNHYLCAHNGKEFDYPYIARRALINGLSLPKLLQIAGKKPWEVKLLDTMELWKFGDYKSYTSLDLLTSVFDIPTPKDDIDGSMVNATYWIENDLEKIVTYCQKDVVALTQLFLKMNQLDLIPEENIQIIS
jgi:hypothetical protein